MNDRDLIGELLTNKYYAFYLVHPDNKNIVARLVYQGYYNDETGQPTEKAQNYADQLYSEIKEALINNLRKRNKWTYNELSKILDLGLDNHYLHHYLRKLEREDIIYYREPEDFNSEFKVFFR